MGKSLNLALLALMVSMPCLSQTITSGNTSKHIGNNRWEWTVFIKTDPDTLSKIRCVEYLLHPTFPDRDRIICDRGSSPDQAFPLTANGWGTFDIPVKVIFTDGHSQSLVHSLHFESTQMTVSGCDKAAEFLIKEHEIQDMGAVWPGVYLYAQEIHAGHPSHFYLVKSTQSINPGSFDWVHHRLLSHPKKQSSLSSADKNAYVDFSPPLEKLFPLALRDSKAAIYVKDPHEHKSISIAVCR
jgi:hypothetical protein